MAQLNIRLEDDLRDGLDALARARGHSVSDEVRDMVRQALGRSRAPDGEGGDDAPASLSALDRSSWRRWRWLPARILRRTTARSLITTR
jgi:plasmid stability protein